MNEPLPAADVSRADRAVQLALWLQAVQARPEAYDLWQVLRRIEASHPELPRLGEAVRPADEPVRVTSPAELTFAPATLTSAPQGTGGGPVRIAQRAFGLLGPNGPLPLHMTELVRERAMHHGDKTLQGFIDTLTHRFALLFYRAWAQAQPVVGLDRGNHASISRWTGSLFGLGNESQQDRDAAGDTAKLHFAGRLSRQVRDADGLLAWCRARFDVPLRIEQWCGHWMALDRSERTRLRKRGGQGLGRGVVIGESVWDVQHRFRIVIGPLRLDRYLGFLPDGGDLARLQAMVRQWIGLEFAWDAQIILARTDVPMLRLGGKRSTESRPLARTGALGRSAWLGRYKSPKDADALVLDVERTLHPQRRSLSP